MPLLDRLTEKGRVPRELWADRGYHARALLEELLRRGIEPQISKPRRAGDPIPEGTKTWQVARGRRTHTRVADPKARHRWPIERTNAWLRSCRRIEIRRDRKPETYLAFLQLRMIVILANAF